MLHLLFFFFQAEDGIRDYKVTGVQTCALPISRLPPLFREGLCRIHCSLGRHVWGKSMIEVSHLVKSYRDLKAVNDVTFKVEKGEIVGFLGPNGAGKTTTMRMITGVLPPTSGSVRVAGFDVFEQPMEVKKRTGYLPETPPVYTDMTVRAYLRFVAEIKGVPRKERDRDRKSTRLNSSHLVISYAVFCLKKKKKTESHAQ